MNPTPIDLLAHDAWLRPIVRSLVAAHEVDDVLQDTWLAAVQRPPGPGSVRGWLAEVARNFARMRQRVDRRRRRRELAAASPESQPSTAETVQKLAMQARVAEAVAELDEPYREAVILRFHDGLSHRDVATVQNVTVENARQRVKRGLDRIRRRLNEQCGPDWRGSGAVATILGCGPFSPSSAPVAMGQVTFGVWFMSNGLRAAVVVVLIAAAFFSIELLIDSPGVTAPPAVENVLAKAGSVDAGVDSVESPADVLSRRVVDSSEPDDPDDLVPLRGRVVDTVARPVSGVKLEGIPTTVAAIARLRREGRPGQFPPDRRTLALSDSAGRFEIHTRARVGNLGTAPPFAMMRGPSNSHLWDPSREMLVIVARGGGLDGIVSDSAGSPLEGVVLRVDVERLVSFPEPLDPTVRAKFAGATTGPDGRFRLTDLPSDHSRVVFSKPGYRSVSRPISAGLRTGESVILEPLKKGRYTLSGSVFGPDGRTLDGVRIAIGAVETRSAANGAYRLALDDAILTRGEPLFAARSGMQTFVVKRPTELFATGPNARLDIVIPGPARSLGGRVLDPAGRPVAGMHVRLWMEPELCENDTGADLALDGIAKRRPMEVGAPRVYAVTEGDGRFRLEGLQDKPYQLRLRDPSSWLSFCAGPFDAGRLDLELTAPTDAIQPRVEGRVVGRDGRPVAGIEVQFCVCVHLSPNTDSWDGPDLHPVTGDDGRFGFSNVPIADEVLVVAVGDDILVKTQRFRGAEVGSEIVLTVDRLCQFRVDAGTSGGTRIALRGPDDEPIKIWERRGKSRTSHRSFSLTRGRTPILSASVDAQHVVILDKEGKEVDRLPIQLVAGQIVRVRR